MRTDSPAHKTHTWPSREEWGRVQRTPYADLFDGLGFSRWAGDFVDRGSVPRKMKLQAGTRKRRGQLNQKTEGTKKRRNIE